MRAHAGISCSTWRNLAVGVIVLLSATASRAQNVIGWGANSQGQINVPASATNVIAVAAGFTHSLALRADGSVISWGSSTVVPANVTNATSIAAGANHSLALLSDMRVAAWGNNTYGQTNVPASATNVVAVAAGFYHCLALRADGRVIAWGKAASGQTNVPTSATSNVVAIAAGAEHSIAMREDGSVVIWGGVTGTYPLYYATTPMPRLVRDVVDIAAGAYQNLALSGSGQVACWGFKHRSPRVPAAATNVVAVVAGTNYNLALTAAGDIIAWGTATVTNVPASATNIVAMAAGLSHCLAVVGQDMAPQVAGGIAYRTRCPAGSPLPLSARATGSQPLHYYWLANGAPIPESNMAFPQLTAVLGSDSVEYQVIVSNSFGCVTSEVARVNISPLNGWGDDLTGQTKPPDSVTNVVNLTAGASHALALKADGTVAAWGKNWDGQTNVPAAATNVVSVAAGTAHNLALKDDGSVIAWGRNWNGQTDVPPNATNVVAIAAGWAHSLALRADGRVVVWGNDDYGQGSDSFLAIDVVAISAGYYHNLALRANGTVVTWAFDYPTPTAATNVVAVAAGWEHCLALRADGSVVAWGDNSYGQSEVPTAATNVVGIAAGYYHNLALRADGTIVAWGKSYLGVTNAPMGLTNGAAISAGEDYSLVLAASGPPRFRSGPTSITGHAGGLTVLNANVTGTYPLTFQWFHDGSAIPGATNRLLVLSHAQPADSGSYVLVATNAAGQASSQPTTLVIEPAYPNTAVGAWGDNLSGQCDVSHAATTPCAVAAGAFHALALNSDGSVAAWGKNWDGQTNVPPEATNCIAVAAGGGHSLALLQDGSVLAWGRNSDGQTNVPPGVTNAVAIAAGWAHSLALKQDGTVVAWGNNDFGQTNVPSLATGVIAIAAGYGHCLALLSDRSVVAWGSVNTVPGSATNVVAVAGGLWHSLALRADGSVVAWGDNSLGQCAVPPAASNVVQLAAGYYHNLAIRADGTVLAWGKGAYGATNVPDGLGNVAGVAAGQDYSLVLVEMGPPRFGFGSGSAATHVGGQAIFSTEVTGTHPLSLQWFHTNEAIAGATSRSLVLASAQMADEGSYTLVAVSGAGQTNIFNASLGVLPGPAIAETLSPRNVMVGTPVCLPAKVSGAEPLSYRWRLNGTHLADDGRITGSASNTLCLTSARGEDSGTYSLILSNAFGCVTGMVACFSVSPVLAWGDNSAGQTTVPVGTADVVALAAGSDHSLALRANSSISAWGDNSSGQSAVPGGGGGFVAVSDGDAHSLALRLDGTVVAWGDNSRGQASVPASATNVVAVAAGGSHSLALRLDGTVVAWGSDASGQRTVPTSTTNAVAIAAGEDYSLALRSDGTLVKWGALLPPPAAATNIVAIAAGGKHALALRGDGALIAWGANYFGQTSVPNSVTNAIAIAAGGDYSLALLADGTVIRWGADYFGQASAPLSATNILAISAGATHALALAGDRAQRPTFQPFGVTVTVGQPALLSAGALAGGVADYQWEFNGLVLPGATRPALALNFVTWTNAGVYRLVASNAFGRVAGPPVVVTVLRTPLRFDTTPMELQMTNDGLFLRVLGASGVGPVVLMASSDLLAWEPIQTNPPVIGPVSFFDAAAAGSPARFYRAFEGALAGPVNLEVMPTSSPAAKGSFPLRLTGLTAAGPVIIYASSNLLDRAAIFTNPPTIGPLLYRETPSTVQPQRFYRASENR
jgi:alpha-tubulin suppressor-like RCC1 family protein